jgi:hypothetical protein
LATNSSGHIFTGTYFGSDIYHPTDDSWTPINNALYCGNIWSRAIDPVETIFCRNSRIAERASIAPLITATGWTLANLGLTSTNVAAKMCPVLLICQR